MRLCPLKTSLQIVLVLLSNISGKGKGKGELFEGNLVLICINFQHKYLREDMFSFLKQYFYFISNEKQTEKMREKMGQNGKCKRERMSALILSQILGVSWCSKVVK